MRIQAPRLGIVFAATLFLILGSGWNSRLEAWGNEDRQAVVWTSTVNVTVSGNSIQKTGGCDTCDDAGAISSQQITSGDGYVEFTIPATDKQVFAGLSHGNTDTTRSDIDFALKFNPFGVVEVRENNVYRTETAFAAGDVFTVAVVGGQVTYSRNGSVFYTSTNTPVYPLLLDTSLQSLNAVVANAFISQILSSFSTTAQAVVWTNTVNVTVSGNSIQKTGGCDRCDDAGASSSQQITSGDGYVEFTIPRTDKEVFAGLSHGDSDTTRSDIDFALKFDPFGVVEVRENDVFRTSAMFAANDVFRVAVVGGRVTYSQNGGVFYTSTKTPVYPLLLDTSLQSLNGVVANAVISGKLSRGITVAITSPPDGATVGGTIEISATASDNVVAVEFRLDGAPGLEDTTVPYSVTWNTPSSSNGTHTLTAVARDANGNTATSAPVTVNVFNETTQSQCASSLTPFPGSTEFNNTVRAQMWVVDSTWWGAFSDALSGIYFYQLVGGSFVKGALIDANFKAGKPDALFTGSQLFILVQESGSLAQLYKYSYSSGSYTLISGFPVMLPLAGLANAINLHRDSTGKLWATYTSGTNVYVIWSTSSDHKKWDTTGVILASGISDLTTEAATVTAFGGNKIGVLWGNQAVGEYAFRFHRDGDPETSWSPKEIVDCCIDADGDGISDVADDHASLRAAPDGRLFAVLKDSIGKGHLHLYIRGAGGGWGQKTNVDSDPFAQPTRPLLLLDVQNNQAYVIYKNSTDQVTYVTSTSMDSPAFPFRCMFMSLGTNPTSTKQNLNGTTNLVGVVSDAGQLYPGLIGLAP